MKRAYRAFQELLIADEDSRGKVVFHSARRCECGFFWVTINFPVDISNNLKDECPYCLGNLNFAQEEK
jgi:hypothetical protein